MGMEYVEVCPSTDPILPHALLLAHVDVVLEILWEILPRLASREPSKKKKKKSIKTFTSSKNCCYILRQKFQEVVILA